MSGLAILYRWKELIREESAKLAFIKKYGIIDQNF